MGSTTALNFYHTPFAIVGRRGQPECEARAPSSQGPKIVKGRCKSFCFFVEGKLNWKQMVLLVESKLNWNWNWNWKYKVIYCRTGLAYILYHRSGLGQTRHVCPVCISSLYINQITFAPRATFCSHLSSSSTPPPPTERWLVSWRKRTFSHLLLPGLHYYTIAQTSVKRV